jgi:hypothetical protein
MLRTVCFLLCVIFELMCAVSSSNHSQLSTTDDPLLYHHRTLTNSQTDRGRGYNKGKQLMARLKTRIPLRLENKQTGATTKTPIRTRRRGKNITAVRFSMNTPSGILRSD